MLFQKRNQDVEVLFSRDDSQSEDVIVEMNEFGFRRVFNDFQGVAVRNHVNRFGAGMEVLTDHFLGEVGDDGEGVRAIDLFLQAGKVELAFDAFVFFHEVQVMDREDQLRFWIQWQIRGVLMQAMPNRMALATIGQELVKRRVPDESGVFTECGLLGPGEIVIDFQARVGKLVELLPQMKAELSQTAIGIFQLFHFQKNGFLGMVHLN